MGDDALRAARDRAAGLDPAIVAARVGAEWDSESGVLRLPFFDSVATVTCPGYEVAVDGRPLPPHIAALVVYHLSHSDGTPPTDTWISFAALPDASFYATAFRGYTAERIARRFGEQPQVLLEAVGRVGGEALEGVADRAWRIPALPRVPVALLWWDADDEFAARAELLFDESASHHLTTDGCAVLGSWLTSLLTSGPRT